MFGDDPYCRSCGISDLPASTDLNGIYLNQSLIQMYFDCTNIDMRQDTYSRLICEKCYKNLIQSFEFRTKSQETQAQLIERLGKIEFKQEIDEDLGPVDSILNVSGSKISSDKSIPIEIEVKPFDIGIPRWSDEDDDFDDDGEYFTVPASSPFPVKQKRKKKIKKKPSSNIKIEKDDHIDWNGYCCLSISCNEIFQTPKELTKHYEEMKGNESHQWGCDLCEKLFITRQALFRHLRQHHKEIKCEECNEIFIGKNLLEEHIKKLHKTDNNEVCSQCGKVFATRKQLNVHRKCVHENEMNFVCHFCGKNMFTKINLENHLRVHTQERPFKCTIEGCEKRFKQQGQVRRHVMTHTTEQNYSCEVCGIKIKTKYYLVQHRKIHFYDGLFKCDLCDMTFARPNYVNEHKKHRHSSVEIPAVCPECGKTFKNQKNLNVHMNLHRETKHICPLCNKMFARKHLLSEHITATHDQIRKWACKFEGCDKAYYRSSHLRHHEKVVHIKKETPRTDDTINV